MSDTSLSTPATMILASLAERDRHGYAIRKDVTEKTQGEVKLGITTLYRVLKQLLDEGLVEESRARPQPDFDDERRRYFRITSAGRRALAAEIRRLERMLSAARAATAGGKAR